MGERQTRCTRNHFSASSFGVACPCILQGYKITGDIEEVVAWLSWYPASLTGER